MKKLLHLMVWLSIVLTTQAQDQNFWVKKANFSGAKTERAVSFSIAGKGYVGTGVDTTDVPKNDLWEYDPALNAWTQKANLPGSTRRNAIGFAIGNKGYIGTGMDSTEASAGQTLSDFWEYDPITNSWTQKNDFPGSGGNGLYFATAFTIDNKGYICCGKRGPNDYSEELWEYKPSIDAWAQRADFPGGVRYQLASFVIDNYAYVGLGIDQDTYRKDIWQYNPGNNEWVQKSDFQGGERGSVSTFTIKQRGFVCLGTNGGFKKDLWEYNPFTNKWSVRGNFGGSARKNAIAFTVGDRAFVGMGKGYSGKKTSFYEYIPYHLLNNQQYNAHDIKLYPNPAHQLLIIDSKDHTINTIKIYNLQGKEMTSRYHNQSTLKINVEDYPAGFYIVAFENSNGKLIDTRKITIR